jgi:hypothetical protein
LAVWAGVVRVRVVVCATCAGGWNGGGGRCVVFGAWFDVAVGALVAVAVGCGVGVVAFGGAVDVLAGGADALAGRHRRHVGLDGVGVGVVRAAGLVGQGEGLFQGGVAVGRVLGGGGEQG